MGIFDMKVVYNKDSMRVPMKIWGEGFEEECLAQMVNISNLPHVFHHVSLMPDGHLGKGACIGAVVPLKGAIVVNLVGVDIGCGMCAYPTPFKFEGEHATKTFWRNWLGKVQRDIPSGFAHREEKDFLHENFDWQEDIIDSSFGEEQEDLPNKVLSQLGTLGGGNHFIEAQKDEENNVWIMIHSGSRNIGYQIASFYDKKAKEMMEKWHSDHPVDLNWLPIDSELGQEYLKCMNWAVGFAKDNREEMMYLALSALVGKIDEPLAKRFPLSNMISIAHNYASIENHFGNNVMVHRKGAIHLRKDTIGLIPGSMGTHSFIVKGKGNPDSFDSCSHGAGRRMSRAKAKEAVSEASFASSMDSTFTAPSSKYLDEAPGAYKDIEEVIRAQEDILEVVHTLTPIITLKAEEIERTK
jgi:tRNA-splicing ligase RtcB